jgi:flagellar biosynthesis protein FliP
MPDFLKAIVIMALCRAASDARGMPFDPWINMGIALCLTVIAVVLCLAWYFDWRYEQKRAYEEMQHLRERANRWP